MVGQAVKHLAALGADGLFKKLAALQAAHRRVGCGALDTTGGGMEDKDSAVVSSSLSSSSLSSAAAAAAAAAAVPRPPSGVERAEMADVETLVANYTMTTQLCDARETTHTP